MLHVRVDGHATGRAVGALIHLKVLKEAGLIRDGRDGREMYYRVNAEPLDELDETR